MKLKTWIKSSGVVALVLCCAIQGMAQGNGNVIIPRTNSKATVTQTIAATQIEVNYNRPNKKGREIFGNLVPYGQVWRTGSDESTKIYFSTPVKLSGIDLDSGRYELFTIPGKSSWEVILQKNKNQWGSYSYNPDDDVVRFSVKPMKSKQAVETFTISIDQIGSDNGTINIVWDNVVVPISVNIDLRSTVVPMFEEALTQEGRKPYFQAAMFYYENDIDINRAAELIGLALKGNPEHVGLLYRQGLILGKKGDIEAAIKSAEKSMENAQQSGPEIKAEYTKLNTALLKELRAK